MLPLVDSEAIVLRALNFQEADRVVTLFVRDLGKISALARGARKSVRRFSGLGTCALGNVALRERGGDLWSLESFEVTKPRTELGSDLLKAAHAAYVCELVERLSASHQGDVDLFRWLDDALDLLGSGEPSAERLRCFELGLFEKLGLAPALDQCAGCGRTDLDHTGGRWSPETAQLLCPTCATRGVVVTALVVQALQQLGRVPLAQAAALQLSSAVNRKCREVLAPFIEHHVGGPLKTMIYLANLARSPQKTYATPSPPTTPAAKEPLS